MEKHIIETLKPILEGKASVPEAQKRLSAIDRTDTEALPSEPDIADLLKTYEAGRSYSLGDIPNVSEYTKNDIWNNAVKASMSETSRVRPWQWVKSLIQMFSGHTKLLRPAFAYALLVFVLLAPALLLVDPWGTPDRSGMKGEKLQTRKSFIDFSIVETEPRLIRPDRPLKVNDTIAFRLELAAEKYCSVVVLYNGNIDKIIVNKLFSKGIHDMGTGYILTGNKGRNTLVLISSDKPVKNIDSKEMGHMMMNAVDENATSLDLNQGRMDLSYKHFDVN